MFNATVVLAELSHRPDRGFDELSFPAFQSLSRMQSLAHELLFGFVGFGFKVVFRPVAGHIH
jgi:hypothetical protein